MYFQKLAVCALLSLSFSATADVALSTADILGSWQIDKESSHSDGTHGRTSDTVWTFRADGILEGLSNDGDDHARIKQLRAELSYTVENGKVVKQAAPGRSKMETCVAVEKQNNTMVLKCPSVYYFMTKK